MKQTLNFFILTFVVYFTFGVLQVKANNKIFIMLNVDNTIIDRIDKCDINQMNFLNTQGIKTQRLEFIASNHTSSKFMGIYKQIVKGQTYFNGESNYLSKVIVHKKHNDIFQITECIAIRPITRDLLEKLNNLKKPVKILLTSRNDDARTENLHKNLDLTIQGNKFNNITTYIPRDRFRIKIITPEGKEISAKSSIELRKHYSSISSNDYVILLDHIEDSRFIKYDDSKDLNIVVSKYTINEEYDILHDQQEVMKIIDKIKDFTENN
ncbi:MAG: hypothetical protein J0H68_05755 [Sphingobacteriia bacterium]|nr:hypothetical protein [Sphingobacteriia bacterium]